MTQYDLILTQVTAGGADFTEKKVNIAKGGLLSSATDGTPTVLPAGTNAHMLVRDDAEVTGLKWIAVSAGHTQGTDTGTTGSTFSIDSDGYNLPITAESASKLGFKVAGGATYADIQAKDATFAQVTGTTAPTTGNHLTNKTYVDGLLAANDVFQYKGTIGVGGTSEIAAFNALTTYNAGWCYRVITAGTIKGNVCEVDDIIEALVDRTGTGNVDADFHVSQGNKDGIVTGPPSVTDNYPAIFDGSTGKILKAGTGALGTGAYAAAYVHPSTDGNNHVPSGGSTTKILQWSSTGVAKWVTVSSDIAIADNGAATIANSAVTLAKMANAAANSFIGNNTGSAATPVAMTVAQAMGILWQSVPSTNTTAGTAGCFAKDANYFYIWDTANTVSRVPKSTNWVN